MLAPCTRRAVSLGRRIGCQEFPRCEERYRVAVWVAARFNERFYKTMLDDGTDECALYIEQTLKCAAVTVLPRESRFRTRGCCDIVSPRVTVDNTVQINYRNRLLVQHRPALFPLFLNRIRLPRLFHS